MSSQSEGNRLDSLSSDRISDFSDVTGIDGAKRRKLTMGAGESGEGGEVEPPQEAMLHEPSEILVIDSSTDEDSHYRYHEGDDSDVEVIDVSPPSRCEKNSAKTATDAVSTATMKTKAKKLASKCSSESSSRAGDDDDVVQIVESSTVQGEDCSNSDDERKPAAKENINGSENGGDDVEVVGIRNEQKLPHMRQHCTKYIYVRSSDARTRSANEATCSLCYCYVCDVPARECQSWTVAGAEHCNATDTGSSSMRWTGLRHARRNERLAQSQNDGTVFSGTLKVAKHLRTILSVIKDAGVGDIFLDASEDGLILQAASDCRVMFFQVFLAACGFVAYQRNPSPVISVPAYVFFKALKSATRKEDHLELRFTSSLLTVHLVQNGKNGSIYEPSLVPVKVPSKMPLFNFPESDRFPCKVKISSSNFKQGLDSLVQNVKTRDIAISVQSHNKKMRFEMKARNNFAQRGDAMKAAVSFTAQACAFGFRENTNRITVEMRRAKKSIPERCFSSQLLFHLLATKASSLSSAVVLNLHGKVRTPMMLDYHLDDAKSTRCRYSSLCGFFRCYIFPRVADNGDNGG
jgi:Proliferating cell nuclear antigen, N-terminal domain